MSKLCLAVALGGMMASSSVFAAWDGTISFSPSTHQSGTGGEFNAVTTGVAAPGLGSFPTFCLEEAENIGWPPSGPYDYFINTGAVRGGGGATATDPHGLGTMDNISIGTAWLYSQFRNGTLTLANGTGSYFDANRTANAGLLQNAIWALENEPSTINNYITLAMANLPLGYSSVYDDSNGAFGVVALNLYSTQVGSQNVTYNQDVLAVVPEPTTMIAGALLLLPFGVSTLRRMRKTS